MTQIIHFYISLCWYKVGLTLTYQYNEYIGGYKSTCELFAKQEHTMYLLEFVYIYIYIITHLIEGHTSTVLIVQWKNCPSKLLQVVLLSCGMFTHE